MIRVIWISIGGVLTALLTAGQLLAAPIVTNISPTFGAYGDPSFINVRGMGFTGGALTVKLNGAGGTTAPASATSDNLIQMLVPQSAPWVSGPIYVQVGASGVISTQDFRVIGPGPYIDGFNPAVANVGNALTITGAHFSSPIRVKFTGANAFNTNPVSAAVLVVNVPAGAATGLISVTNLASPSGSYTSESLLYIPPPPVIGFSPKSGRTGTNVFITGASFTGTYKVTFDGLDAANFDVLSNAMIRAEVPANATTGKVRIYTPAGSGQSTSNFCLLPTITGFSPGFGPVGTNVTVYGKNFTDGSPSVTFGGTNAPSVSGVTSNQLTVVVPANAQSGPITVTTTNGTATSSELFYLPARITNITPNRGDPGTWIKVTGENFTNTSAVNFSGGSAISFWVTNNTTLGAQVPTNAVSGPISITTPAGTTNSTNRFYMPPVIIVFNPTHGLPGTNVTLTGQNFFDATAVRFNGSNATFSVVNNTTINATVPTNAQTGPITVVAPAGTNTSAVNFVLDYTANLGVTVTDSPDPVTVTSNLTYSIVVANNGPYPVPNVMLTNLLPGTVVLKSATSSAGAGSLNTNSNPIIGALGQINVGGNATVTLVVTPQFAGTISNFAAVAGLYPDPTPANNTAGNDTLVLPLALLSIRPVSPVAVRVSWPAALTNYTLEFKPVLTTNYYWSNVLTPPTVSGNENVVNDINSGAMKYYRLRN